MKRMSLADTQHQSPDVGASSIPMKSADPNTFVINGVHFVEPWKKVGSIAQGTEHLEVAYDPLHAAFVKAHETVVVCDVRNHFLELLHQRIDSRIFTSYRTWSSQPAGPTQKNNAPDHNEKVFHLSCIIWTANFAPKFVF